MATSNINYHISFNNSLITNKLIINADDFGFNPSKNEAIVRCFDKKIINSASLMVNMDASAGALRMSQENGFSERLGLHACLTEGRALTDLSGTGLLDRKGLFVKERVCINFGFLCYKFRPLIEREIEAQYNFMLASGIVPTHINSHHHVHTLPWVAPIFLKLARKFDLKIRIAQTWNRNRNPIIPLYRHILNCAYKIYGVSFSDRFETLASLTDRFSKRKSTFLTEIMVHPDLNSTNEISDCFENICLEDYLNMLFKLYNGGFRAQSI